MGVTRIADGETVEIISADDMEPAYRLHVRQNDVKLAHTRGGARTGVSYPQGFIATIGSLKRTAVFAHAPNGDVEIELDDATFSIFDVQMTTFTGGAIGIEDSSGSTIDPLSVGDQPLAIDDGTGSQVATETPLPVDLRSHVGTLVAAEPDVDNLAFGEQTVSAAGTAEALNGGGAQAVPSGYAVLMQGRVAADGDEVYVGDSTVGSGDGYPLDDGQVVSVGVEDVSTLFVDADTAGDGVRWIVEVV